MSDTRIGCARSVWLELLASGARCRGSGCGWGGNCPPLRCCSPLLRVVFDFLNSLEKFSGFTKAALFEHFSFGPVERRLLHADLGSDVPDSSCRIRPRDFLPPSRFHLLRSIFLRSLSPWCIHDLFEVRKSLLVISLLEFSFAHRCPVHLTITNSSTSHRDVLLFRKALGRTPLLRRIFALVCVCTLYVCVVGLGLVDVRR